jgi:DNA-binding response OmpR family regulator
MKLLIVEDNQKLNASIKEGLEQDGYTVQSLFDGLAAERHIETYGADYDLIILDIMLPGKDGIEVCEAVRKKNIVTPIIMLTARDATKDRVKGLDAGADDYLIKPFSFDELLARIRALLRRPKNILPDLQVSGPLTLNAQTREVLISGERMTLTFREFSILQYLMRHPNQVVSREQIMTNVWDHDFDSFSNVVDVHIKNIRKKLKNYGNKLQAIRGIGYRLAF